MEATEGKAREVASAKEREGPRVRVERARRTAGSGEGCSSHYLLRDAAASFMALLQGSGYAVPDAYTEATQTITKFAATEALGQLKISQLSGLGVEFDGGAQDPIEEWTLHNCLINEVNYGDLDYESDDINEITVKVRYDWATLTQSGEATTEAENRRDRADAP